jgi:EAL domain-containing protein (putative c-di-GMP-specific phosphodiesterase class I)
VSVNLSADDLAADDVRDHVEEALRARRLPGRALRIEITEDQLVSDPPGASRCPQRWRDAGVGVANDDYGTGYSSLAYLKELPVDEVKLDRVFAGDIGRRTTTTIVRHTVAMAHGLGLRVVAEGMEDAGSARALAELGCDVGQGNYFGEPMTVERFLARLTSRAAPDHAR